MKVIYGLYANPEMAQQAVDALHAASADLKFNERQIVIISGEPHEGYDFADSHLTTLPYRWAVLGGAIGALSGYLLTTLSQKGYPIHTGGMPVTPLWTNGIIIYELTMLGAILMTFVVLLRGAKLPNFKGVVKDPEVWLGKILVGVAEPAEAAQPELEKRLLMAGATEVKLSSS